MEKSDKRPENPNKVKTKFKRMQNYCREYKRVEADNGGQVTWEPNSWTNGQSHGEGKQTERTVDHNGSPVTAC